MNKRISRKAFSLIELSIVIVIISILITGVMSASISSINNARIKVTNDRMNEIYKAIGNYLLANGKLPCPAALDQLKSSSSTYGNAIGTDGTCSGTGVYTSASTTDLVYGMVPVKTLKLGSEMAEDGFESKIVYIVDKRFTDATTFYTGFVQGTPDPTPAITITENPSGRTMTADFALVSYGANKAGSFGANSSSQTTRSSDSDELNNDLDTGSPYFNNVLISSSTNSDLFDDIVFYKKRTELVRDFNAMYYIPCQAFNETLYGTTVSWPLGRYDQAVVSTTACPAPYDNGPSYPVKRCGSFGQWGVILQACV